MKLLKRMSWMLALTVFTFYLAGCATGNVDPSQARANTGYVDFHAGASDDLSWQVACLDESTGKYNVIYSEVKPLPDGILRLAIKPGHYRFHVTFLNRVISEPAQADVEVQNGMITPVRLDLVADGTRQVQNKETSVGKTVQRYAARKNSYSTGESEAFEISAKVGNPMPYQTKEHTVYAN